MIHIIFLITTFVIYLKSFLSLLYSKYNSKMITCCNFLNKSPSIYFLVNKCLNPRLIFEGAFYLVMAFSQANTTNILFTLTLPTFPWGHHSRSLLGEESFVSCLHQIHLLINAHHDNRDKPSMTYL